MDGTRGYWELKAQILPQKEKRASDPHPTLTDPPMVTLSAEPQTVQEGEKVTFLCQATAQPPVTGYR